MYQVKMYQVKRIYFEKIAAPYNGINELQKKLNHCKSPKQLIWLLFRYVQFNAVFGSGVANLSGAIGSRFDLFRKVNTGTCVGFQDASVDIAAKIFFAAIDEFGGDGCKNPNHRQIAKNFLSNAAAALGQTPIAFPAEYPFFREVCFGYGIGRKLRAPDLFRAIGFHNGSEFLADQEFRVINESIAANFPELAGNLKGYEWITMHGGDEKEHGVEDEHSRAGLDAANAAIEFYNGRLHKNELYTLVLKGFSDFAKLQARFMKTL